MKKDLIQTLKYMFINLLFWYLFIFNETPLYTAANNGQKEITKILLQMKGINVNIKSLNNDTPLKVSVQNNYKYIVKLILSQKSVNINIKDINVHLYFIVKHHLKLQKRKIWLI